MIRNIYASTNRLKDATVHLGAFKDLGHVEAIIPIILATLLGFFKQADETYQ